VLVVETRWRCCGRISEGIFGYGARSERAREVFAAENYHPGLCAGANDKTAMRICRCFAAGQILVGYLFGRWDSLQILQAWLRPEVVVRGGSDAKHHTRAKHGRALAHGYHERLQSGVWRGSFAANFPDD